MAGGPNCWGKGLQKGARGWGQEGWGKGDGGRGWGEALIEVLNKTGIITFSLVIVKHFTRQNRGEFPILGVIPIK